MCDHNHIDPNNPFAGLEDEAFWNAPAEPAKPSTNRHVEAIGNVEIPGFVEDCPKCRGTGNWRPGYPCFKCKGKGKLQFRTSPEARAKSRASARRSKAKRAVEDRHALLASLPEDVRSWLLANEPKSSFAADLLAKGAKYGHLTEGQIGGVRKCIARDVAKAEGAGEWIAEHEAEHSWLVAQADAGNELAGDLLHGQYGLNNRGFLTDNQLALVQRKMKTEAPAKPSDLDISGLKGYYAVPDGDTRLKLCVRRPGKNSRYHGWTFVDDGAAYGSRRTYGKQAPGGKYIGDVQDQLRAILADPMAAHVAYGKLTGTCGVCGRLLEDEDSVAAGIGPVCASKF